MEEDFTFGEVRPIKLKPRLIESHRHEISVEFYFNPNSAYMIRISSETLLVYKGNLKAHFMKTLEVLLWYQKGTVPSPFKVTTKNHSHTIRTDRSEVAATRSYIADDLNLQK